MQKAFGRKKVLLMFLLPALVIYVLFVVVSVVWAGFYSFFDWSGVGEKTFIGIQIIFNWRKMQLFGRLDWTYADLYCYLRSYTGALRTSICNFFVESHKRKSNTTDIVLCTSCYFISGHLSDFQ